SRPPPPRARIPMPVNDSDDDDVLLLDPIEDAVGKAIHERASQVPVDHRRCKGRPPDTLDGVVQRRSEHPSKTAALLLVPPKSLELVFPGFVEEDDADPRSPFVISAYTSSQATPAGPSRSSRSSRRSSSARSAGESAISSGERLRQRSSIRSYFSSAVSFE